MDADFYSQGIVINASEVSNMTAKSEVISECTKLSKVLNGGLFSDITD